MPSFNQTGPMGQGPMTGRGMGRCNNFGTNLKNQTSSTTENNNENLPENFQGRGLGMWFGRGRGGRCFGIGRQNRFRGGQK